MNVAVPLAEATDASRYGGKAAQLGAALARGLPVPPGFALAHELVDAVARGDGPARARAASLLDAAGGAVAVRSSAVGEDGAGSSFAGQHATVLNVRDAGALAEAVRVVWSSARSPGALAYRAKRGIAGEPRIGVVVQRLVEADCAGVLFTRDPITGADERVVEAAWGLGEAVVAGLVTPDRYRVSRAGAVLAREVGEKDLAIRPLAGGGTVESEVDPSRANARCLSDDDLARLHALASQCEAHFGPALDLEWAFAGPTLYLLQHRAITTRGARGGR